MSALEMLIKKMYDQQNGICIRHFVALETHDVEGFLVRELFLALRLVTGNDARKARPVCRIIFSRSTAVG